MQVAEHLNAVVLKFDVHVRMIWKFLGLTLDIYDCVGLGWSLRICIF